jgi:hypothetical protein
MCHAGCHDLLTAGVCNFALNRKGNYLCSLDVYGSLLHWVMKSHLFLLCHFNIEFMININEMSKLWGKVGLCPCGRNICRARLENEYSSCVQSLTLGEVQSMGRIPTQI